MYDTLIALNELWLQQGSALVISKIYTSVSAMEADDEPVSDITGQPLRAGQIVVIASSDSDNGSVYRFGGISEGASVWALVGLIGNIIPVDALDSDSTQLPLAAHQGKVLDGKISQLGVLPTEDIEDADLEFRDENRNILVRFANGHIQTKNFNSAEGGGGGTKELRVLFLGNSLTQDAISYLPLLLKEVAPELKFHFYIFYNGGINLATQYADYLQTPTRNCGIFSEYSSEDDAWTNYSNSKNMNWVIANCDFDMLVLQEYGNNGQSDSAIIDAFNNCSDWFFNNYKKPIKVCNMMDAPARSDVSGVTTRIENYAKLAYGSCYSQGIIPAGRAISYACEDSSLNALGDQGMLSPDGVHAQEGLPCLLQSYVVAMWLFNHLGMNKSIWGSQTRITTAVYTAQNVPGANLGSGVVTGTEAQHLAAQKCAIKALKRGRALEIETLNV